MAFRTRTILCKLPGTVDGQLIPSISCWRRHASGQPKSHADYCMDLVRKRDYENFLSCLLLPGTLRQSAFAVRAFNVELAQILDTVSEQNIGQMRLLFWKETLDKIYEDSPPETPVAQELHHAIRRHKLSKRWLLRILDARQQATDRPPTTIQEVEEYAENTISSIHFLALESLGVKSVHADHAASHLGKAQGIATLLRAVPFHGSRGRCLLPLQFLAKHSVSQAEVARGCQEQKMKDLVFDLASVSHQHLAKARSFKNDIPKEAILAFLSSAATGAYLKNLQKADFDVFNSRLQRRNHLLPLLIWWQKRKNFY